MITLRENDDTIYYLSDVLCSFGHEIFVVFHLNASDQYQLHHIIINEGYNVMKNDQMTEQIDGEHCCCCGDVDPRQDRHAQSIQIQFISCSQFLSLIQMSCEIDDETNIDTSNLHIVAVNHRRHIYWLS